MKKYFISSLLLSVAVMLPEIVLAFDFHHFLIMIFTVLILWVISAFNRWAFVFFLFYLIVVNIVILHTSIHWGYAYADLSPRIAVMLESPKRETLEYFKSYIDYRDFLIVLYAITLFYFIYKFLQKTSFKSKKIKFIALLVVMLLIGSSFRYIKEREPYNIIPKIISLTKGNKYIEKRHKYLSTLANSGNEDKKLLYDKIIFVLGESVNKLHLGLYGYSRHTTPFLSELSQTKGSYIFNVIAPSNLTRVSVPIYMTGTNKIEFYNKFIHSPSFLLNFKKLGYPSLWLSAQSKVGSRNDMIAECANDANKSIFINNFYNTWGKRDIEIVKTMTKDKKLQSYKMILLHLTGSHAKYTSRYDKNHRFMVAKNMIDEYDNSIFYTDYVLENIFNLLVKKNKKVLFIYISDHGEIVNTDKNGHGFLPPSRDEYDIPFFIYSSIANKRIDELKAKNKKHYFNMENLKNMIEYISGYSDDINISYSSKVIATDPQYIFDYDKLNYYGEKND